MASRSKSNQQAQSQPKRAGGLGELGRVEEINGHFPMRQRFAQFAGDKGMLPVCLKTGAGNGDGPGVVIQQCDNDVIAQGRFKLLHDRDKARLELVHGELRAEDEARGVAGRDTTAAP